VILDCFFRPGALVRWTAVSCVFVIQSIAVLLRSTDLVDSILPRKIDGMFKLQDDSYAVVGMKGYLSEEAINV
jgi:hypothetical protein